VDLDQDFDHCGGCGRRCSTNHVAASCIAGSCELGTCEAGFADCNRDKQGDGCEVDLGTDVAHCGGCGAACSPSHVAAACSLGSCEVGTCEQDFADCNGNKRADGCEVNTAGDTNHCGGCGMSCSGSHVTAACAGGSCQAGTCEPGFDDCNGDKRPDGCEVDLRSSAAHCGACNAACSAEHVTPACVAGVCAGACEVNHADCNADKRGDGCEVDTSTDPGHCGGCGVACSANHVTPICAAASCQAGICDPGFDDCNGDKSADGCEVDLSSNMAHCGACAASCNGNTTTCVAGACRLLAGQPCGGDIECASGACVQGACQ
jgi:hypothetical protein